MYYVVGLGKTGQAFLKKFPQSWAWDDQLKDSCDIKHFMPPHRVPWEKVTALILSPGIPHRYPKPHPIALQAMAHEVPIWCDIEVFLQTYPQLFTIGVSGTNGKSTTTALIHHMLTVADYQPLMGGNIGQAVFNLHPKTPQDICVLELSSYQLERTPSWSTQGHIGVLTHITPDHLERHKDLNGYIQAKESILKVPQALIGIDTPPTAALYEQLKKEHPCLVPVSVTQLLSQGISVHKGHLFKDGQVYGEISTIHKLPGQHNSQNMALAFGVGQLMNLPTDVILKSFHTFPGLAHRLEWVGHHQAIHFVNDSKGTNPEATYHALAAHQDIYWILGGQAKSTGLEGLEAFYHKVKKAYVIGEAAATFEKILSPYITVQNCGTLDKAVAQAWHDAHLQGKGTILLSPACASWDQYASFEARGDHFKSLVQEWLESSS